jgi:hypothetical protein
MNTGMACWFWVRNVYGLPDCTNVGGGEYAGKNLPGINIDSTSPATRIGPGFATEPCLEILVYGDENVKKRYRGKRDSFLVNRHLSLGNRVLFAFEGEG